MSRIGTASVEQVRHGPETTRPLRFGILGHVGNENLGDEAIIAAVVQNLRRRWPDAEIFGFTADPADTEKRHGIRTFPIRRRSPSRSRSPSASTGEGSRSQEREPTQRASLPKRLKDLLKRVPILFSAMRGAVSLLETVAGLGKELSFLRGCRRSVEQLDLLIFAGSHQLNDFVGGPWAYPYTVLKWTALAKAAGAKVAFLSLGAGPIDTWLGRRFIRSSLKMACYRSYRDETAKRMIDSIFPFEKGKVVPDLAFSLELPAVSSPSPDRERRVVGINPLPLYAAYWHANDDDKYRAYVAKVAGFADWLVDRGCEVRFIPTQLRADPAVIADVKGMMTRAATADTDGLIAEPPIGCLDDLVAALSKMDLVVATRYHGILLSLALHKPVLAIAYHQKSRDLMSWLGLGEYVVEGDTFEVGELTARFPSLETAASSITSSLKRQVPEFRSAVQAQYDEIARFMEGISDHAGTETR